MGSSNKIIYGILGGVFVSAVIIFTVALLVNYGIIGNNNDTVQEKADNFVMSGYTLEEMAKCVVDYYITDDMSIYDKYKTLHDFIVDWAKYDHMGLYTENPETHDPRLVFSYKRGVCDAYAKAYKALCDEAGLYCRVISGLSDKTDSDSRHAWNIIMLGGISYHVDVTWDDPCYEDGGEVGRVYDYWLLSDDTLKKEGRQFVNNNCNDSSYEYTEHPNRYD